MALELESISSNAISRRDFLKIWATGFGTLAISVLMPGALGTSIQASDHLQPQLPPDERSEHFGSGRVTISAIGVYQEPDFKSERLRWLGRDKIVNLYEEVNAEGGYSRNKRWYRVYGGYAHSAYLQRVESAKFNQPLSFVPKAGRLAEVTVPFTQALRYSRVSGWQPLYRLYFGSVYWITGLITGPDRDAWYELTDDRLHVTYCVPAAHLRPISREEIKPISSHLDEGQKRIEIDLSQQIVYAYEEDRLVYQADISSGIHSPQPTPNGIPTDTPQGNFHISLKTPSRHMGDGDLTSSLDAYELPGVPWVSFFHAIGVGFHGTYWHDNFGSPMSHGCVNMRNGDAKWLYRWTTPEIGHTEWYKPGWGTLVNVH